MPKLRVLTKGSFKDVRISDEVFRIGRSFDNDYVVDSPYVSRRHCEIRLERGNWVLYDLGSKLETAINGKVVDREPLANGDRITFSDKFEAEYLDDAEDSLITSGSGVTDVQTGPPAVLISLDSPLGNQRIPLMKTVIRIGRDPGSDIHLPMDTVSSNHAELHLEKGTYVLLDLNSANGTFVDDHRIRRHELQTGELVRFDQAAFRYEETTGVESLSQTRVRLGLGETKDPEMLAAAKEKADRTRVTAGSEAATLTEEPKGMRMLIALGLIFGTLFLVGGVLFAVWTMKKKDGLAAPPPRVASSTSEDAAGSEQGAASTIPAPIPAASGKAGLEPALEVSDVSLSKAFAAAGDVVDLGFKIQVVGSELPVHIECRLTKHGESMMNMPWILEERFAPGEHRLELPFSLPGDAEPGFYALEVRFSAAGTAVRKSLPLTLE